MATTNPSSGIITYNSEFVNLSLGGIDHTMCTEPDNDKPWRGLRYLPDVDADVMIVSSYGHVYPQHVKIAEKLAPSDCTTDRLVLAREELDCLLDLYKQAVRRHLAYCYPDHGGLQMSKDYYLQRMKKLLMESEKKWVHFYTGNSEEGTGNWCFKDGVITFQDIYDMYIECFKGKRLSIISDCSYSGNWVKECAKVYDNQGILSCGHHSREKGILLDCRVSSISYQQATILAYVKEAMKIIVDEVIFSYTKQLSTGQQGTDGEFTIIQCNNQPNEQCEYNTSNCTWMNTAYLAQFVYLVRGKDRGRPAWHYVLVDEDKVQQFKDKLRSGSLDVGDYGKVLYSGWGKDPPQDIKDKLLAQFGTQY